MFLRNKLGFLFNRRVNNRQRIEIIQENIWKKKVFHQELVLLMTKFFFPFWDQVETFVGYLGDMISNIWRVWTSFRGQEHSNLNLRKRLQLIILEAENL